jgi:hypothetical protein
MAFAVGASLAGGVAVAADRATTGQLRACANHNGVLRLARTNGGCPRGSTKVRFSVKGPQGKTGPRGLTGIAGPSHAYSTMDATASIGTTATDETALVPSIPAGAYTGIVTVRPAAGSPVTSDTDVTCTLSDSLEVGLTAGTGRFFGDGAHPGDLTLAFTYTTAAGALSMSCLATTPLAASVNVVLTQVGGLTTS